MKTEYTAEPMANVTPWMWTGGGMIQHAQGSFCYITDAAAELAALRQSNQQLREALEQVIKAMGDRRHNGNCGSIEYWTGPAMNAARVALTNTKP